ncbi:MAG: hypothetical protein NC191_08120 [Muribaculaceae bacterium]|nr:hypothetical protein [Muribaculaceae bacterium]
MFSWYNQDAAYAQNDTKKPLFDFTSRGYHTPGVSVEKEEAPKEKTPVVADEEPKTKESEKAAEQPVTKPKSTKRNISPQGWYRANNDLDSNVKGITIANMKKAEAQGTSAATFVLDRVLGTKMGKVLSAADKADLLGEIIRKNPSVFDKDGKLKTNARIERLDVPSMAWLKKKYNVQAGDKPGTSKPNKSMDVIRGNNGYYAKLTGPGAWLYFNPQGKQITGDEFKKHCPTIHKNIQDNQAVDEFMRKLMAGQNPFV